MLHTLKFVPSDTMADDDDLLSQFTVQIKAVKILDYFFLDAKDLLRLSFQMCKSGLYLSYLLMFFGSS